MVFFPSKEESGLVAQILARAGGNNLRVITGDAAVEVFTETVDLPPTVLSEIWNIADEDNSGNLSERGLAIAVRLIGWAQMGEKVTSALVNTPGPIASIRGISDVSPSNYSKSGVQIFPPFTASDWENFYTIYEECGPIGGFLDGEKATESFLKSNLSPEQLWQIWDIADFRKHGKLDANGFALGMYLIQGVISGQLASIPSSVPKDIYQQISMYSGSKTGEPHPRPSEKQGDSRSRPLENDRPHTPHPKLETGHSFFRKIPVHDDWAITPAERLDADRHFDILDPDNIGFVEGDTVARFMLKFKLPPEDLAHIWDLADINDDNNLTRDGFAVAMHLVQQKSSGYPLPFVLPPSLIPPSSRIKASKVQTSQQSLPNSPLMQDHPKLNLITKPRPQSIYASGPPLPPKPDFMLTIQHSSTHTFNDHLKAPTSPQASSRAGVPLPESTALSDIALKEEKSRESLLAQRVQILEQENATLESYTHRLLDQLGNQHDLQAQNDILKGNNETLSAKVQEMEHLTSQLIATNEQNTTADDLARQNKRLLRRVANMEGVRAQLLLSSRRLEICVQENQDLKRRLTEIQDAAEAASRTVDDSDRLRTEIRTLKQDNKHLQTRTLDMEKSIRETSPSDPAGTIRELRILMGDVTRENEDLKQRMRDLQNSTTSLLLSTGDHAANDELRRHNQRLSLQVQELGNLTRQLQSSSEDNELRRVLEQVTQENEGLKTRVHDIQRLVVELQGSQRSDDLQREIDALTTEVRHLKARLRTSSSEPYNDTSAPPPAYDDDFIPV